MPKTQRFLPKLAHVDAVVLVFLFCFHLVRKLREMAALFLWSIDQTIYFLI